MLIGQLAEARRKGRAGTGEAPAQALSRQSCSGNAESCVNGESRGRRIGSPVQSASWVHDNRDRFANDTISNVHRVHPTAGRRFKKCQLPVFDGNDGVRRVSRHAAACRSAHSGMSAVGGAAQSGSGRVESPLGRPGCRRLDDPDASESLAAARATCRTGGGRWPGMRPVAFGRVRPALRHGKFRT